MSRQNLQHPTNLVGLASELNARGHTARVLDLEVAVRAPGVGEPMPIEEVRVAQVLRLNGLVRGHSGVREEVVDKLVRIYDLTARIAHDALPPVKALAA